jgi:UDP-N-acetylmuramyl pentapeptide synthase
MHAAASTCSAHLTDLSVGDLVDIIGGFLRLADMPPRDGDMTPIERIVTDPRHVQAGDVYWAIPAAPDADCRGAQTDAACEALMRGAAGVVSKHRVEPFAGRWAIEVADPLVALWELAHWRRDRFCGAVVAVCGDDQDTTSAMIDCILRCRLAGTSPGANAAALASIDSDARLTVPNLAVPLALVAIDAADDYAIVRLAANGLQQAEALAALCRPRVAVVAGADESNAAARQTLSRLSADGFAVLSGDDAAVRRMAAATSAAVRTFGRCGDCDVAAAHVEYRDGCLAFDVDGVTIHTRVWGRHHLHAALAAYTVGRILEFTPQEIAAALAAFAPPPGRYDVTQADGLTIIHDSASPGKRSLVALELLRETAAKGRRFVVCGDEAGDETIAVPFSEAASHRRSFGEQIVTRAAADRFVAYGPAARELVAAARDAGMPLRFAIACREFDDAAGYVAEESQSGDVVLLQSQNRQAANAILARRAHTTPLRRAA